MNFLKRDTGGNLIIAAHHPKWSLTWAWVVSWSAKSEGRFFYAYRANRYAPGLYGVVKIGRLRIERQPTMLDSSRAAGESK